MKHTVYRSKVYPGEPDWYLPEFEPKTPKYINPRIPFWASVFALTFSLISFTVSCRYYCVRHATRTEATETRNDSTEIHMLNVPHIIPLRL